MGSTPKTRVLYLIDLNIENLCFFPDAVGAFSPIQSSSIWKRISILGEKWTSRGALKTRKCQSHLPEIPVGLRLTSVLYSFLKCVHFVLNTLAILHIDKPIYAHISCKMFSKINKNLKSKNLSTFTS